MTINHKILGIIPARGGSKGIPRKNIIDLCGKPLIFYTISSALNSQLISHLVVSTDDEEIASIASSYGVEVIKRPESISNDKSPTEDCLIHALNHYSRNGKNYEYVVILEPTSPFRKPSTIDFAIEEILKNNSESLLTVIKTRENIGTLNEKRIFKPIRKNSPRRRQDRSDLYIESSTLYVTRVDFLLKNKSIVSDNWFALEISKEEAIDINTFFDLDYARYLMQNK